MSTLPETATLSLRIPRGLWHDLEDSVYQQDRQFLTEVARSLGLPPADVIRRCIGTMGESKVVPLLWAPPTSTAPATCPYWECHGDGLWRRCPRIRLSDTLPCAQHERTTAGTPHTKHATDAELAAMPWRTPVRYEGDLYWVDPTGIAPPYNEQGFVVDCQFKRIRSPEGSPMWVYLPPA